MSHLLEVNDLKVHFPAREGTLFHKKEVFVRAVDGVGFDLEKGETLGLVGESGCGKSTLARAILRLVEPTGGSIKFENENLSSLSIRELRKRRRNFQMIFQDPYASLDPRMTVEDIIAEPLTTFGRKKDRALRREIQQLLVQVGLNPRYIRRYPHEFSGGQRQRIGIARALALRPKLVIADEPVSALDVSIQAQILNLLQDLKKKFDLTYLFIAHDLAVVRHISDRIAVMYLGKIVEIGPAKEICENPQHPYTQALLASSPIPDPRLEKERRATRQILAGDLPSRTHPPSGCAFHTRCPRRVDRCLADRPFLKEYMPNHRTACHLLEGEIPSGQETIKLAYPTTEP
ncbi:MAG: ATP-binding cassette domain-containing protein [Deltaproteobacteria bacterium]|nr:ATP-binding cassette domain-containing protein [Deltaproteobacteria bacterium]